MLAQPGRDEASQGSKAACDHVCSPAHNRALEAFVIPGCLNRLAAALKQPADQFHDQRLAIHEGKQVTISFACK